MPGMASCRGDSQSLSGSRVPVNRWARFALCILQDSRGLKTPWYDRTVWLSCQALALPILPAYSVRTADLQIKSPCSWQGTAVCWGPQAHPNCYLRVALYMPALSAARHNPHVRGYYQHLINSRGQW